MKEKKNIKKRKSPIYNQSGITIIVLVLTIVLMLILVTVTIGAINGGLLNYAGKAKKDTESTSVSADIEKAYIIAKSENNGGDVTVEDFQAELDYILGENTVEVIRNDKDGFAIKKGDIYFLLDNKGNVQGSCEKEGIQYPGDITKGGSCTGTSAKPYRIDCIEDLVRLAELTNKKSGTITASKYYVLTRDLDFNSIFSYNDYKAKYSYDSTNDVYIRDENSETTIKELCTTGQGFIPIGLNYDNSITFKGTFYGTEQRTIKNIYINRSGTASLFGAGTGVTIRNITVEGSITSTSSYATGIVGTSYNTTIKHCYNKAKIEGKTSAAGIYCNGDATITDCGNEGEIFAKTKRAAGIALNRTTINRCYNTGNISCDSSAVDSANGICGKSSNNNEQVKNCYNTGDVKSTSGSAGGIGCWSSEGFLNCYNSGYIEGNCYYTGGNEHGVARNMSNKSGMASEDYKLYSCRISWKIYIKN